MTLIAAPARLSTTSALKLKQAPLRRIIDAFASAIPADKN